MRESKVQGQPELPGKTLPTNPTKQQLKKTEQEKEDLVGEWWDNVRKLNECEGGLKITLYIYSYNFKSDENYKPADTRRSTNYL